MVVIKSYGCKTLGGGERIANYVLEDVLHPPRVGRCTLRYNNPTITTPNLDSYLMLCNNGLERPEMT